MRAWRQKSQCRGFKKLSSSFVTWVEKEALSYHTRPDPIKAKSGAEITFGKKSFLWIHLFTICSAIWQYLLFTLQHCQDHIKWRKSLLAIFSPPGCGSLRTQPRTFLLFFHCTWVGRDISQSLLGWNHLNKASLLLGRDIHLFWYFVFWYFVFLSHYFCDLYGCDNIQTYSIFSYPNIHCLNVQINISKGVRRAVVLASFCCLSMLGLALEGLCMNYNNTTRCHK